MKTLIRPVGAQFKYDDPEFYGKLIPAIKHIDGAGGVTYEFGDGAFVGYPLGSKYSEYAVIEIDPMERFGRFVYELMEEQPEWSSDTFEDIALYVTNVLKRPFSEPED